MEKSKETLADIVRQQTPTSRGRRKSKTVTEPIKIESCVLDEDKMKVVDQLFENAQINITKLEDERISQKRSNEVIAPKVKIIDGKMVIDRDSIITACAQTKININELTKIQETGIRTKKLKKKNNERWNEEETQLFYTALQLFGTDFEMIANFMKNRKRNQIKSKYKKENKINPLRIEHAIWNRIPLSKEAYQYYIKKFNVIKEEPIGES